MLGVMVAERAGWGRRYSESACQSVSGSESLLNKDSIPAVR